MPEGGKRSDIDQSARIFVGEDRSPYWDVTQSDDTTAQTMTGWALTFEVLDKRAGTVQLTKTTGAGEITIGNGSGTDDRATVTLTDADTEALGAGKFYYQLRRTDAANETQIAYGDLIILAATVT